mmetsp:Transcript_31459/g.72715  ORF Transcript_31459/g.72715 Transcript_31459/m.72715 type:complete len:284 (-) Transcript_31459:615-1466(-)
MSSTSAPTQGKEPATGADGHAAAAEEEGADQECGSPPIQSPALDRARLASGFGLPQLVAEDQLPEAERGQRVTVKREVALFIGLAHDFRLSDDPSDEALHGLDGRWLDALGQPVALLWRERSDVLGQAHVRRRLQARILLLCHLHGRPKRLRLFLQRVQVGHCVHLNLLPRLELNLDVALHRCRTVASVVGVVRRREDQRRWRHIRGLKSEPFAKLRPRDLPIAVRVEELDERLDLKRWRLAAAIEAGEKLLHLRRLNVTISVHVDPVERRLVVSERAALDLQ